MAGHTPFTQQPGALPATLPVFPLTGAILMPFGHLPLNIFEPRYLNMVNDALSTHRLIGMIQPIDNESAANAGSEPELSHVGCAGRIVRYEETRDGRLEILLAGLSRFTVTEELSSVRGYRLVRPDWTPFTTDMESVQSPPADQVLLFRGVLRHYLAESGLEIDSELLDKLAIEDLVNSLVSVVPLAPMDKQLLLEANSLTDRLKSFTAILQEQSGQSLQH